MDNILQKLKDHIKEVNGIYVPFNNKLEYRLIKLKNKLQIFFIKNENTNISSANMYVNVGSIDNPIDIAGMAHYLEHMLFMGSDIYPGETYFQNCVSGNGGTTNAFTTDKNTQYFFNTSCDSFVDILHIFSRFFVAPLFDIKYVEKEVSAVDSEHKKNISSDNWRSNNLAKLFLIDNVNSIFSTGTKKTLLESCNNSPDILRDRLIDFYNIYYSSDKMVLFISHKDISDNFVTQIQSMFEHVPLKKPVYTDDTAIFRELNNKYELIKMQSVIGNDHLDIKWLVNTSRQCVNNIIVDSFDIVTHIIGHEGENSLFDILLKSGLIIELTCDIDQNFKSNSIITLHMNLTKKGYDNWLSILHIINYYINNLINIDSTSDKLFNIFANELNELALLDNKIVENINGLTMAHYYAEIYDVRKIDLKYIPIINILTADLIDLSIRRKNFTRILNNLKFNKMKILLSSSNFENHEVQKIDKYYGTLYDHSEVYINEDLIQKCKNIIEHDNYAIPVNKLCNKYISNFENMKIIDPLKKYDENYYLIYSDKNIYYLKKGNTFETFWTFAIITIDLACMKDNDPNIYIIILMYFLYISKIKNTDKYMMKMVHSNIHLILSDINKITINIDSCSDKTDLIFDNIMKWYYDKNSDIINEDIYEMIYDDLLTELTNYQYSEPFIMVSSEFRKLVNPDHTISNEQMINALKYISPANMKNKQSNINFENFREYAINLISIGHVCGIFGGSISLYQTNKIINILDNLIMQSAYNNDNNDNNAINAIKYTLNTTKFNVKNTKYNLNPNNNEKAIAYGLYIGNLKEIPETNWMIKKPFCMMLQSFISEKFSALVRTQQQVGYIAFCTIMNVNELNNPDMFLIFIVQSTKTNLEEIVQNYIDNHMLSDINSITDERFEIMKQSIITKLSEKPLNIAADVSEKIRQLETNININDKSNISDKNNKNNIFDNNRIMIESLKKIKGKTEFVKFVQDIINNKIRAIMKIESYIV